MNNLHKIIVEKIELLIAQKTQPSEIIRKIFLEFGEIAPPIMAQYFKSIYFLSAMIGGAISPNSRNIFRIISDGCVFYLPSNLCMP